LVGGSALKGKRKRADAWERDFAVNQLVFVLMRALGAGSAAGTGALALQRGLMLMRDNLVSNAVGFLLVSIAGLADAQLGLNDAGFKKASDGLIAERALKVCKSMF
jgi:hypothetical protein